MSDFELQMRRLPRPTNDNGEEICAYASTFLVQHGGALALEGAGTIHDVYAVEEVDPATQTVVATAGIVACSWSPFTAESAATLAVSPRLNGRTPAVLDMMRQHVQRYRNLLGEETYEGTEYTG